MDLLDNTSINYHMDFTNTTERTQARKVRRLLVQKAMYQEVQLYTSMLVK